MVGFEVWLRGLFGSKKEELASHISQLYMRIRPNKSESFAEDSNAFAFAIYRQLRQGPGNLFFSPFSIRAALSMTYAGAKGETATQMRKALRFPPSDETLYIAFAEIIQQLNAAGGDEYEIAAVNSLWSQTGAPLQAEFIDLITRYYGRVISFVDFRSRAGDARVTINQWVEDKTKLKIQELISPGSLDIETRLVLVNAVYFKGMWVLQFCKSATRNESFYLENGGTVRIPLMYQHEQMFYLQTKDYQAVDLDYQGGILSMLVLLPNRKDGLQYLEKTISAKMISDCVAKMRVHEVKLFLPRFRIIWGTVDMRDQLTNLGMTLPFSRFQADFSGISGYKAPEEGSLFISAVYHKAFLEVNEKGTEATAATAVLEDTGTFPIYKSVPVPTFRADHPFLFAIRDRKSGTILFLGRMDNPMREN